MSKKEIKQAEIFSRLAAGDITQKIAANMLNISTRWVREKLKRYKKEGASGLLHKSRGQPSQKKLPEEIRMQAKVLMDGDFKGFGPTFFSEKMEEIHGISLSRESARKMMIEFGFHVPKKQKRVHRKRRERRECVGMLVQLDGSRHDWFEGRAPECTLLVFIDDATSRILWLEFAQSESMHSVMQASWHYFDQYGLPVAFYTDYGSVFRVNTNNPDHEKKSQFERALKELEVTIIHASSPQAKGRVERANGTLQDRLIKEMRLANISSIEQANKFVQAGFIQHHNDRFAVAPAKDFNAHRSIEGIDLARILCFKEERVIQNDFVISYKKRFLQLDKEQRTIIRPKEKVVVSEHLDGSIKLSIRKTDLFFKEICNRQEKIKPDKPIREFKYHKPAPNHPWRSNYAR